jgi:hypothetical protein
VLVAADGRCSVCDVSASGEGPMARGKLGVDGWPTLPGGAGPKAGHFTIGAATAGRVVVVQMGG